MNKLQNFIEKYIGRAAVKASKNKYISTLANGFMMVLPIIMIGSFASVFSGISVEAYQNFIVSTGIKDVLSLIMRFTTEINSIYLVIAFTYLYLKKRYQGQALCASLVSMGMFMILTPTVSIENTLYISFSWLGAKGMFMAILIGLGNARLFEFCFDKGICIKMPKGVPNFIDQMYKCLVPALITLIASALLAHFIPAEMGGVSGIIYTILALPLKALSGLVITRIILDVIVQMLWFFGIHGGNITSAVTGALYTPGTLENIANFAAGQPLTNMVTSGFTAIANAGAYTNICICILCMISKKKEFSSFGKMAFIPTLFMVSEPLRFGLPTVLNFYFFIPLIINPIINDVIVWFLMVTGIIGYPRATYYQGSPFFFNSIFNLGVIPGLIVMALLLVVDFIIVYPFFKMYEKQGMTVSGDEE